MLNPSNFKKRNKEERRSQLVGRSMSQNIIQAKPNNSNRGERKASRTRPSKEQGQGRAKPMSHNTYCETFPPAGAMSQDVRQCRKTFRSDVNCNFLSVGRMWPATLPPPIPEKKKCYTASTIIKKAGK